MSARQDFVTGLIHELYTFTLIANVLECLRESSNFLLSLRDLVTAIPTLPGVLVLFELLASLACVIGGLLAPHALH